LGIVALLIRRLPQTSRESGGLRALGRGPYRSYDCEPDAESVASLTSLLGNMRIEALEYGWHIDWKEIDEQVREAHQARQEGDFRTAIVKQAAAVRLLMKQIRRQRGGPINDSRIGL
jgi:hypothetical protein